MTEYENTNEDQYETDLPTGKPISIRDQANIKSIIKQSMKTNRSMLEDRRISMHSEVDDRMKERFADYDVARKEYEAQIEVLKRETEARVKEIRAAARLNEFGGSWSDTHYRGTVEIHAPNHTLESRNEMRRYLTNKIDREISSATVGLDMKETELLRDLAVATLTSRKALDFLGNIPKVDELVAPDRVGELEAAYEAGAK